MIATKTRSCGRGHPCKTNALASFALNITHDCLAQMLGVRWASVTEVLRALQTDGMIRASRGKDVILDPKRQADSSCECYRVIRREYQRLLG